MWTVPAALQLSQWVGRNGKGAARLQWGGHEVVLHVSRLQIVGAEGYDGDRLAAAFGLIEGGDWFAEAQHAVERQQVSQAEANAVIKRTLAETLFAFFSDPAARVSFDGGAEPRKGELAISFPHLMVELVLGPNGTALLPHLLPDPSVVLRRLPEFPRRVGALGLTEEGMAILAKIDDRRSAADIAKPSPHGENTVLLLLAAALAAGIVEAVPPLAEVPLATNGREVTRPAARSRRRWLLWVGLLLVVGVVAAYLALARPWGHGSEAGSGGPWGVAVDGGCQPAEVERLYRRQETDTEALRVVPFGQGDEGCFRLMWGHFGTREEAEAAVARVPSQFLARGFVPHAVRVPETGGATGRR